MAECDTGRPWVAPKTYEKAREDSGMDLELFAHTWVVHRSNIGSFRVLSKEQDSQWITMGWWSFPPYNRPITEHLLKHLCLEIRITPDTEEEGITIPGLMAFDDRRYFAGELDIPEMIYLVLNTEEIAKSEVERGFGYYILVLKESKEIGKYERLGIGVAFSERDHIPRGLLGRNSPTNSIILV
jgi:hypothetical protein